MKFLRRRILPALLFLACVGAAGRAQDQPSQQHVGRVQDWSYRHLVLSGGLQAAELGKAQAEPRILSRLAERNLRRAAVRTGAKGLDRGDRGPRRRPRPRSRDLKIDWSVPLGAGIVAPYMFPAKYSFNINDTPNCTNDYVVFGLNVAGATGGQANLIGLRNLYSGTAPAGLCPGAAATFYWAYNGSTAGGSVLTSPVVSLDGTKVAYVESAAGSAVFHVLKWKSGEGTSATASGAPTLSGACTVTSSCLQSVTFSAASTATLASPWVDYSADKAFVGSDNGKIYRISCVFNCALNTQPTVDWTFTLPVAGTGGASATPNGPVYDSQTGHLIVGDQLGELWTINASGGTPSLFAGPVMVGGGGCSAAHPPGRTGTAPPGDCTGSGGSFGIPDSVLLDGSTGKVFAFSGNDGTAGASAVVAQLNENLTGLVRVHIGRGSQGVNIANWNIHSGAFDDAYFGATPANGHLFVCGTTAANNRQPTHYWIGFDSYPTMNATPDGSLLRLAVNNLACAPYTELFNPNITLSGGPNDHDLLISGLMGAGGDGYIITNDISTGIITAGEDFVNYPGGVSGIVVDNTSAAAQASSVYFSTQGVVNVGTCANSRCAVKLTQSGLQ